MHYTVPESNVWTQTLVKNVLHDPSMVKHEGTLENQIKSLDCIGIPRGSEHLLSAFPSLSSLTHPKSIQQPSCIRPGQVLSYIDWQD